MLTACARGAASLHFDLVGADLDLAVVVHLGHDLEGGEAGLTAGVGIEGADAHQTMNAVLALEVAVGILALNGDGGGLDACFFACFVVQHLIGVAMTLGPAGVHTIEHLRPVLCLRAACTCVEGQNGVVGVVLTAEKGSEAALVHLLLQHLIALGHIGQQGGIVLLLCHLAQGQAVLPVGHKAVVLLDLVLQALELTAHRLAALEIVPKALLLRLLLQGLILLTGLGDTQCLLQLAQHGLKG